MQIFSLVWGSLRLAPINVLKGQNNLPVQPTPSEHLQRKYINVVKIADGNTIATDQFEKNQWYCIQVWGQVPSNKLP